MKGDHLEAGLHYI